jgi:hypothetical protein
MNQDSKSPELKDSFKSIKTSSINSDQEFKPMKNPKAKKSSPHTKESSKKSSKNKTPINKQPKVEKKLLNKETK